LSELTPQTNIRTNDINNANSDVRSLLGELCFAQLCAALKAATEAANLYNEDPLNVVKKSILEFLETRWLNVVTNLDFKTWYSNRVAWHWLEGSSITQLKSVGLITTNNDDKDFKNGFKHAEEAERKRLAAVAERIASNAGRNFKVSFWDLSKNAYSCQQNCACNENPEAPGMSIGMSALNK